MLLQSCIGHRSTLFPLLSACRFVEFDTSVIFHCLYNVLARFQLLLSKDKSEINRDDVVYLHSTL